MRASKPAPKHCQPRVRPGYLPPLVPPIELASARMSDILFDAATQPGVAIITLNRPDVLSSFNRAMSGELREAFERVAKDDSIRAVVLTGAGRGFCAGQDL